MKVVLLAPLPPPAGGIASWTERMVNAQLKNNWEVVVVDEKVDGGRQVFGDKSRRNFFIEVKRCCRIWSDLKKALKDPDVRVVHSCIPSMTLSMMREYVCACIAKRKKKKFIMHFRCTVPNTTKGRLGRFMLKKLCDKSDCIITLNKQTSRYLSKITKTPLRLIPNFISTSEFVDCHVVRPNIEKILYVGGVIETKGAFDVLKIASAFPEIQFRMVGKSSSEVEEAVKRESVDNVVLVGPKTQEEVKQELADADVFLFMSYFRGEGFSNALCEAMAAGLPCIVTDWAANADMVENHGGFVVTVHDVDAAVNAIHAMNSPTIRRSQSEFNINKAKNCYSAAVVLGQYVDVYEKCLV